jgi:hypothetical protein
VTPNAATINVAAEKSSLLMLRFPLSEDALLIGLAGGEQMIEDSCQLMSCGGNGFWSAEFGAHALVVMAKNRLVVMQRVSGDAERKRGAVLHVAGAHGKYLAAADTAIGTQAQP